MIDTLRKRVDAAFLNLIADHGEGFTPTSEYKKPLALLEELLQPSLGVSREEVAGLFMEHFHLDPERTARTCSSCDGQEGEDAESGPTWVCGTCGEESSLDLEDYLHFDVRRLLEAVQVLAEAEQKALGELVGGVK